ncbi:diguanylate cyclase [Candidatus Formimonas warabiya]|uniref:Diguanylate cyclase n=1 Tax=Formimonas warabiya TaxID=1761012 RepID=A0A3G1KQ38_FORW1|nr:diguanylate cyclase [Candidatus Formimonas warabiya]ATW24558.1 hypothetical protein DCMF_06965 [Candidatus Formimonas warabiya]
MKLKFKRKQIKKYPFHKKIQYLTKRIKELELNAARSWEILNSIQEVVFEIDREGKLLFSNESAWDFFGYEKGTLKENFSVLEAVIPEQRQAVQESIYALMTGKTPGLREIVLQKKDGTRLSTLIHSIPIFKDGKCAMLRGVIMDISERKKYDRQLEFISTHDSLTGLKNRMYFEKIMEQFHLAGTKNIGLIMCDVDGLKLVNDSLGHAKGDFLLKAAAEVIQKCFRDTDIVARIGGDEFAVLLSGCTEKMMLKSNQRLADGIKLYNASQPEVPLNISIGYAFTCEETRLEDLYQHADNNMYREKLHQRESVRSHIVKTLLKTLELRDIVTEQHGIRLGGLVLDFAEIAGIPKKKYSDLQLFAQFHDVGKVAIPDHILKKKSQLNAQEREKMKSHCEIGYRIALSSPDLAPIADWILKHHEWWDGNGYPCGLRGEEIPIECRILAIADTFDVMTNDRPYKKALSFRDSLRELKKCAGTQFDPELVPIFIHMMLEKGKS